MGTMPAPATCLRTTTTRTARATRFSPRDRLDGLEDEVAEWIEELTNDRRGSQSFLEWLKDGKVLCRMANIIKPGSVHHINENCTTPWKEQENVSAFIKATRAMGLMEKDTF